MTDVTRRVLARCAVAGLLGGLPWLQRAAVAGDTAWTGMAASARVAGRELRLNGAGIGFRVIFQVYAMGLYVVDAARSASDVLDSDEPRRLAMALLRDISGDDFSRLLMDYVGEHRARLSPHAIAYLGRLNHILLREPGGLRRGDVLTMDWVPGIGVVLELNRRPLLEPLRDPGLYSLLLGIWLGDRPADPALKGKLLGQTPQLRAAAGGLPAVSVGL